MVWLNHGYGKSPYQFRELRSILLLMHNYLQSDPVEKEEAATGFIASFCSF